MRTLKELFDYWLEKQKNESNYNWKCTGIAKESFTGDGIVCEDVWNGLQDNNKERVLYILREANGSGGRDTGEGRTVDECEFWFKQCVCNDNNLGKNIFKRIAEIQKVINRLDGNTPRREVLKEVAYMNINKRGGHSSVNWPVLNNYAKKYRDEIMEEIAIIQPDIIVCCGTYWTLIDNVYDKFNKENWEEKKNYIYEELEISANKYAKVINVYHPSARISDEKYMGRFKEIYDSIDKIFETNDNLPLKKDLINIIMNEHFKEDSDEYMELCDLLNNINEKIKLSNKN